MRIPAVLSVEENSNPALQPDLVPGFEALAEADRQGGEKGEKV